MNNIILQVITTFSLILGVISGETASNKLFGYNKKWYLNIIEVFIFVTLLIILFNNFYVTELNPLILLLTNFFFGLTSITITRGIVSGIGFFSVKIKKKYELKKELNQDVIIIGLTRNLLRKGLSKEEIRNLLVNSGMDKRKVKNNTKRIKLERTEVVGTERNKIKNS